MLARLVAQSKSRPDVSLSRALLVAAFIGFWMLAVSARLVYLQVSQHSSLTNRARQQQQNALDTTPQRGELLDRNGRQLARSIQTISLFLDPGGLDAGQLECTAQQLSNALGVSYADLSQQLSNAQTAESRFLWIARRLDVDRGNQILALELPGIHPVIEPKRYYPNGSLASHVLGYVGIDGQGLGGVEHSYNSKIKGEPGELFLEKDATGRAYESFEIPAKPGQTVVLTIDQTIQYHAEQALQAAVERSHAKSGTAIVLDPRTGEILALANAPTFDPNKVSDSTAEARSNWALQNIYEPGSTFKIVAYSAAIDRKLAKPDDHIDCQMGAITVAGRVVHDHHPFGLLTLTEALAKSSNVGAIKLGIRVGDESMYDYITRYGFGSRTGIELMGETPGLLRKVDRWQPSSIGSIAIGQEIGVTPLQMVSAYGAVANDGVRIAPHLVREVRNANGSVVYSAQPEQRRVVNAEAAIALRGMLEGVTLHGTARKAQLDGYSAAGKTGTAQPEQRRVVNAEAAIALRGMLEGVTLHGTARKAQLDGYSAAGKTGTAQKIDPRTKGYSSTKFVGSFVGFAPVNNPQVAIIVVIDEPSGAYHGGDVAAPVFREIAEQILPVLGVEPDLETTAIPELIARADKQSTTDSKVRDEQQRAESERRSTLPTVVSSGGREGEVVYAVTTSKAIVMPDLYGRSVRDVARTCAQLGLQIEARGEGRVMKQSPAAGAEVGSGQVIYVDFGRAN